MNICSATPTSTYTGVQRKSGFDAYILACVEIFLKLRTDRTFLQLSVLLLYHKNGSL